MKRFGQGVPGVTRLLYVEGHVDGFRFATPLAVHLPAGQFLLKTALVNSQEKRREGQNCGVSKENHSEAAKEEEERVFICLDPTEGIDPPGQGPLGHYADCLRKHSMFCPLPPDQSSGLDTFWRNSGEGPLPLDVLPARTWLFQRVAL